MHETYALHPGTRIVKYAVIQGSNT